VADAFREYVSIGRAEGAQVLLIFIAKVKWDSQLESASRFSVIQKTASQLEVPVLAVLPKALSNQQAFHGGHPTAEFARQIGTDIAEFLIGHIDAK
jgi:hypothetical protein